MGTLTVWRFPSEYGAQEAENTLLDLQKQELITLHDAAVVTWPQGSKKPKTRQLNDLTGAAATSGMFWGLLFGLIFLVPFLGAAIGAGMGALTGSLADVGIDDDFIKRARDQITPGTSALFVITSGAVLDRVHDAFQGQQIELIQSNLSKEQEEALRLAVAA